MLLTRTKERNVAHQKFDMAKLERLNDPGRFDTMIPEVMWGALGAPSPEVIVEIGAGTGLFAERFSQLAPHATVYAVDMAPEMVAWMTEHRAGAVSEDAHSQRLVALLSTETAVPLADGTADLVVMLNVHHELANPAATYAEAYRLLRPGGQVLVVDWATHETPKGPPQAIRASVAVLEATLSGAGFSDIESHPGLVWHSLMTARRPA